MVMCSATSYIRPWSAHCRLLLVFRSLKVSCSFFRRNGKLKTFRQYNISLYEHVCQKKVNLLYFKIQFNSVMLLDGIQVHKISHSILLHFPRFIGHIFNITSYLQWYQFFQYPNVMLWIAASMRVLLIILLAVHDVAQKKNN